MPNGGRWLLVVLGFAPAFASAVDVAPPPRPKAVNVAPPPRLKIGPPPTVEFLPESTRHPDPTTFDGSPEAKLAHEWGDKIPLVADGRILIIYSVKSDYQIRSANLRYRVVARGFAPDAYPEEYQKIPHPMDDPNGLVYKRLPLKAFTGDPEKLKLGKFVPDLGLFEQSWRGLKRDEQFRVNVELYILPGGKEAGGRINFEVAGLTKTIPDGKGGAKTAKLELGDTVEVFVEVFDNAPGPDGEPDPTRLAGYTIGARRKIVLTKDDAIQTIKARDEEDRWLREKLKEDERRRLKDKEQERPKQP